MKFKIKNKSSGFINLQLSSFDNIKKIIVLAVIYIITSRIGISFATFGEIVTLIWPPSGIALAALIMFGMRLWPGVLIGAFFADFWITGSIMASLGMSLGSTISALLAAWLILLFIKKENPLTTVTNLYKFFAIALISSIIAANAGPASLVVSGIAEWSDYNYMSWSWWLGDTAGVLVFTPLLIAWQKNIPFQKNYSPRYLEIGFFIILLIIVSTLAFVSWLPTNIIDYPLAFITFPFCIWAAYRYGIKEATMTILLVMTFAVYGTGTEQGPFYQETLAESLLQLQTFMLITVVTTLTLATAVFERYRLEAQLITEKKHAEKLTQEKSQFLSHMSHELRTPLNAIIGFSHVLKKDKHSLTDSQQQFVTYISDAGNHLLHLVNDLLDIEQCDAHKLDIHISRINLHDSITESIRITGHMANQRNIKIDYDPDAYKDYFVMADEIRFRQILINLFSNAAKYNHQGGRITVTCHKTEVNTICIAITDNGEGIAAEDLPKIFEPFHRLNIENRNIEGSGIGLTVTAKLIELMHGSIKVESTIGEGSVFSIELPISIEENPSQTKIS